VLDASRSVTVAGSLLSPEQKPDLLNSINTEYTKLRADFGSKKAAKNYLPFPVAQENKVKIDWENYTPVAPKFTGLKVIDDIDPEELVDYIDWQPFFIAWELHGKFPQILTDEVVGKEATRLYHDARALLKKVIDEKWLTPKAVVGYWVANSDGKDTVTILTDENGKTTAADLQFLRQQIKKAAGQPNISLADYIMPAQHGKQDFLGAFAVTIHGIEEHIRNFEAQHDDYNKIMLQALADRLAEALAEMMHARTRKEYWGYAADETLDKEALIKEKYSGIRPAPGYPACPDHTEKYTLFNLLDAHNTTGITLTESLAMYPASSVCGWYFGNPESKYFGVGKIEKDQVVDYAARKKMPLEEIERWLRPVLEYDA
jgi:5-methyltetrahydrofolate--homocysteine methyltransferase